MNKNKADDLVETIENIFISSNMPMTVIIDAVLYINLLTLEKIKNFCGTECVNEYIDIFIEQFNEYKNEINSI